MSFSWDRERSREEMLSFSHKAIDSVLEYVPLVVAPPHALLGVHEDHTRAILLHMHRPPGSDCGGNDFQEQLKLPDFVVVQEAYIDPDEGRLTSSDGSLFSLVP